MKRETRLLLLCGALALGEAAASCCPTAFAAWPLLALLTCLVGLFGDGFARRGWLYVFLALLGATLFLRASESRENYYRAYPWMRHARHRVNAETLEQSPLAAVRQDLSRRAGLGLEHTPETADLNRAILLGERTRLPARTRRAFVDAGTIHIFAISGLHVMVVAQVLMLLMLMMFVPIRLAGAATLPILWLYVLMIGAPPSAIRAATMASLYLAAPLFWRRANALVAWSLAFLTLHLLEPTSITEVGSTLSFAVMLAILLAVRELPAGTHGWRAALVVTFVAWAAGVPIAAHAFGRVTPGGLFANIVLIPAATFSVVTGMLGLLASYVSTTLAAHFNNVAALLTDAMVGVSHAVASLPGASVETERWSILMCIEWYALLFLVPLWIRLRRREPF